MGQIDAAEFNNWQRDTGWDRAPYNRASPNLVSLLAYLIDRWGGASLGIHGDRPIRGGQSPSSHAFGAALDWRWGAHPDVHFPNGSLGRAVIDNEVLPFLIDNSEQLGVQAIHDQGRIWRPTRTPRWKPYDTGYGPWLHIETSKEKWGDGRPVPERISVPEPPPVVPPPSPGFDPVNGHYSLYPLNPNKNTIGPRQNTAGTITLRGDLVRYFQGVAKNQASQNVTVDGWFGPQTEAAARNLQAFFKLQVDGYVGSGTWPVVDFLSSR